MAENNTRVIVVGAGIAGLTAAYYLSKRGNDVTICERGDGHDCCSFGNAGLIAPRHVIPLASPGVISQGLRWMLKKESPFYIKPRLNKNLISWLWKFRKAATAKHVRESGPILRDMLFRNQDLLVALEKDEQLNFGLERKGHLTVCETKDGLKGAAASAEKARALGVPAKVLSPGEVREIEPNITMDIQGAVYYPKDAHIYPNLLMEQFKQVLKERGVRFQFNTEIASIREHSGRSFVEVISSAGQKFEGTHAALCCGAWTPQLMDQLDLKLPVQAGKGYSITLKKPSNSPQVNLLLAEKKVAVTPMADDLRFAGTMEIVGLDKSVTKAKVTALKKSIVQYLPDYSMEDLKHEKTWVGLRPCSPDGMPYVGKMKTYSNVFVSSGYSMVGMSLSFASGEIISQLINDGEAKLTHPLTDPNRYM